MKKSLYFILISILLVICITGCSQNTKSQNEIDSPILDKIYIYDNLGDTKANYAYYYGTYDINNSAFALNISDKTYAGVILEDGASIQFGNEELVDWTDNFTDTGPLLNEFD